MSDQSRGFSLVEMMVVLGIVMILLTLLMSPLFDSATRASYTATCGSNLNQIALSRMAFEDDHTRPLKAGEWASLKPYVSSDIESNTASVFICPEEGELGSGELDDFKIGIATRNPKVDTNISYYIPFAISPLNVRMSQEQVDQVTCPSCSNFFARNPWYKGYVPGANPNLYYIWFEDIVRNGAAAGDQDFSDIQFKVEIVGDEARIQCRRGAAGYRHFLFDGDGKNMLGAGPITTSWTTVRVPMGNSNYGMNPYTAQVEDGSGKIFAIDYKATVVRSETWSDWDDMEGTPSFARHKSNQLNALGYDGSVRQMNHADINPEFVSNEIMHWQP